MLLGPSDAFTNIFFLNGTKPSEASNLNMSSL